MIIIMSVSMFLLFVINLVSSCRVYSGLGDPCIFPFRINGTFYAECTTHFVSGGNFSHFLLHLITESSESMCPTRLADEKTLEASSKAEDWGVCSRECPLKYYRSNQQIYDKVSA